MYRWIPYAFVRITAFYCAGIVLAIHGPVICQPRPAAVLLLVLIIVYVAMVLTGRGRSFAAGATASLALVLSGVLNVCLSDESRRADHLLRAEGTVTAYRAVIRKAAEERPRTWKYEARIDHVMIDGVWKNLISNTLIYIRKDTTTSPFAYGDVLLIQGTPERIPGPQNPGSFDLRRFNANRQVYFQSITSNERVLLTGYAPPNQLALYAITARLWAENILSKYVHGEREQAMAAALVLGITDGLDRDLMDAYSATGAMHVLSVSGLHVGIVYWLLLLLFKPFGNTTGVKWPLLIVSLMVLWSYAFVTGICASVLRAVVMSSFAAIAKTWNHKISIYNIMAATACCLLVYDPFMIMSVGFQLSFVAVLGIVAIQPVIYRLWEPASRLWDEIWKVCAVSVAAQVATLPLCLYYFHQFPNYFLVTNLFIVPGSFLVLILGIALLATAAVSFLAQLIGWMLEHIIALLNNMIFAVEQLPFSVIGNIFITAVQCWILLALVVIVLCWLEARCFAWLASALVLCASFPVFSWMHSVDARSPRITVYSVPGATAVDLIADGVARFIGDSSGISGSQHVTPNRILTRSAGTVTMLSGAQTGHGSSLYVWKGLSILHVASPWTDLQRSFPADLVIISNNAVRDMETFSKSLTAKCFIIDSSNSNAVSASLANQAARLKLNAHAVLKDGAYNRKI